MYSTYQHYQLLRDYCSWEIWGNFKPSPKDDQKHTFLGNNHEELNEFTVSSLKFVKQRRLPQRATLYFAKRLRVWVGTFPLMRSGHSVVHCSTYLSKNARGAMENHASWHGQTSGMMAKKHFSMVVSQTLSVLHMYI